MTTENFEQFKKSFAASYDALTLLGDSSSLDHSPSDLLVLEIENEQEQEQEQEQEIAEEEKKSLPKPVLKIKEFKIHEGTRLKNISALIKEEEEKKTSPEKDRNNLKSIFKPSSLKHRYQWITDAALEKINSDREAFLDGIPVSPHGLEELGFVIYEKGDKEYVLDFLDSQKVSASVVNRDEGEKIFSAGFLLKDRKKEEYIKKEEEKNNIEKAIKKLNIIKKTVDPDLQKFLDQLCTSINENSASSDDKDKAIRRINNLEKIQQKKDGALTLNLFLTHLQKMSCIKNKINNSGYKVALDLLESLSDEDVDEIITPQGMEKLSRLLTLFHARPDFADLFSYCFDGSPQERIDFSKKVEWFFKLARLIPSGIDLGLGIGWSRTKNQYSFHHFSVFVARVEQLLAATPEHLKPLQFQHLKDLNFHESAAPYASLHDGFYLCTGDMALSSENLEEKSNSYQINLQELWQFSKTLFGVKKSSELDKSSTGLSLFNSETSGTDSNEDKKNKAKFYRYLGCSEFIHVHYDFYKSGIEKLFEKGNYTQITLFLMSTTGEKNHQFNSEKNEVEFSHYSQISNSFIFEALGDLFIHKSTAFQPNLKELTALARCLNVLSPKNLAEAKQYLQALGCFDSPEAYQGVIRWSERFSKDPQSSEKFKNFFKLPQKSEESKKEQKIEEIKEAKPVDANSLKPLLQAVMACVDFQSQEVKIIQDTLEEFSQKNPEQAKMILGLLAKTKFSRNNGKLTGLIPDSKLSELIENLESSKEACAVILDQFIRDHSLTLELEKSNASIQKEEKKADISLKAALPLINAEIEKFNKKFIKEDAILLSNCTEKDAENPQILYEQLASRVRSLKNMDEKDIQFFCQRLVEAFVSGLSLQLRQDFSAQNEIIKKIDDIWGKFHTEKSNSQAKGKQNSAYITEVCKVRIGQDQDKRKLLELSRSLSWISDEHFLKLLEKVRKDSETINIQEINRFLEALTHLNSGTPLFPALDLIFSENFKDHTFKENLLNLIQNKNLSLAQKNQIFSKGVDSLRKWAEDVKCIENFFEKEEKKPTQKTDKKFAAFDLLISGVEINVIQKLAKNKMVTPELMASLNKNLCILNLISNQNLKFLESTRENSWKILKQCYLDSEEPESIRVARLKIFIQKFPELSDCDQLFKLYEAPPYPNSAWLDRFVTAPNSAEQKRLIDRFDQDPFAERGNDQAIERQFKIDKAAFFKRIQKIFWVDSQGNKNHSDSGKIQVDLLEQSLVLSSLGKEKAKLNNEELKRNIETLKKQISAKKDSKENEITPPFLHYLACIREMIYRTTGKLPNETQMLVPLMACRFNHSNQGGMMFKIRTGEGKSMVSLLLQAFFDVQYPQSKQAILTKDRALVQRDRLEAACFNQFLGKQVAEPVSQKGKFDDKVDRFVSTASDLSLARSKAQWTAAQGNNQAVEDKKSEEIIQEESKNVLPTIILADEVDSMLNNVSKDILSEPLSDAKLVEKLFVPIHEYVSDSPNSKKDLKGLQAYVQTKYPHDAVILKAMNGVAEKNGSLLEMLLMSAKQAQKLQDGEHFKIQKNVAGTAYQILPLGRDQSDKRVKSGRFINGVHQFLTLRLIKESKENKENKEKLKDIAGNPLQENIPFEKVSYNQSMIIRTSKNLFSGIRQDQGGKLYGLSATFGNDEQIQQMCATHQVYCVDIPSHQPSKLAELSEPMIVRPNFWNRRKTPKERFFDAVGKQVKKWHRDGRPLLIAPSGEKEGRELESALQTRLSAQTRSRMQTYLLEDHSSEPEIIKKAGNKMTISHLLGRGSNIKPEHPEGLVVINTHILPTCDEEQLKGRAARNGHPGAYLQLVTLEEVESLEKHFGLHPNGLSDKQRVAKIRECLDQEKDLKLAQSEALGDIVEQCTKYHFSFTKQVKENKSYEKLKPELHHAWTELLKQMNQTWNTNVVSILNQSGTFQQKREYLRNSLDALTGKMQKECDNYFEKCVKILERQSISVNHEKLNLTTPQIRGFVKMTSNQAQLDQDNSKKLILSNIDYLRYKWLNEQEKPEAVMRQNPSKSDKQKSLDSGLQDLYQITFPHGAESKKDKQIEHLVGYLLKNPVNNPERERNIQRIEYAFKNLIQLCGDETDKKCVAQAFASHYLKLTNDASENDHRNKILEKGKAWIKEGIMDKEAISRSLNQQGQVMEACQNTLSTYQNFWDITKAASRMTQFNKLLTQIKPEKSKNPLESQTVDAKATLNVVQKAKQKLIENDQSHNQRAWFFKRDTNKSRLHQILVTMENQLKLSEVVDVIPKQKKS